MKIMIGGGFDDENPSSSERISMFAQSLARQVIQQGHQLRCGNLTQLDAAVINAGCDAVADGSEAERVISYISQGDEAATNRGTVRDSSNPNWNSMSGRKPQVPEPIDEADVLILIGGYEGTFTAANWARQSSTPVLPVATFGMAASDIIDDELSEKGGKRITHLSDDDLKKLKRSAVTLNDNGIEEYTAEIIRLAERAALSREVFIVMSFSEQSRLDDFRDAVKMACEKEGFVAERIDKRPTGESYDVVEKIHRDIEACGFVVADLTNERPNVYYEIGYARGLGKPVILTIGEGEKVHFDIAGQKRITWKGHVDLREQLGPELEELSSRFGIRS